MYSGIQGNIVQKKTLQGFRPFLKGDVGRLQTNRPPLWKLIMCVQFNNDHLEDAG